MVEAVGVSHEGGIGLALTQADAAKKASGAGEASSPLALARNGSSQNHRASMRHEKWVACWGPQQAPQNRLGASGLTQAPAAFAAALKSTGTTFFASYCSSDGQMVCARLE